MLQHSTVQTWRTISMVPCLHYESRRFGWRRRKRKSQKALAERRRMGIQSMESRRSLFPDIYPTDDNYPLYQSFLKHYKLGLLFNEVFRLKYYDTLFPAMDTMRDTLSGMPPPGREPTPATQSHIDYSVQSNKAKAGSPQILASTIGSGGTEQDEQDTAMQTEAAQETEASDQETEEEEQEEESSSDEYEYEYEYEYEDDEFEDEYDDDDSDDEDEQDGEQADVDKK